MVRWILLVCAAAAAPVLSAQEPVPTDTDGAPSSPHPDAALIEAWGRTVLTGPVPRESWDPGPAPELPTTFLAVETGLDDRAAREALFTALPSGFGPPDPDDANAALAWTHLESSELGRYRGPFDHAYLRVVAARGICFARVSGAELLIVNGEPFVGDPEGRGLRGVPVALEYGDNHLFVVGADGRFELELWRPRTRTVLATWEARVVGMDGRPFATAERLAMGDDALDVPVFNASLHPMSGLHFHYGRIMVEQDDAIPRLSEWADGGVVAPLCFVLKRAYLIGSENDWTFDGRRGIAPLCAYDDCDDDADRQLVTIDLDQPQAPSARRNLAGGERLIGHPRHACLAYATGGDDLEDARALAVARYLQQSLWYHAGAAATVVADHQLSDVIKRRPNTFAVLVGDAKQSLAWRQLLRFDDLRDLLPADIASDQDPERGLRIVGPSAMPEGLPRRIALVHSRSAFGLRLIAALDLAGDDRIRGASLAVNAGRAGGRLSVVPVE